MRELFKHKGARIAAATATTTLLLSRPAFAQTSTATLNLPSAPTMTTAPELAPPVTPEQAPQVKAKVLENYKFDDTSGITDLRLKAEQGSLSRYSGKISFGYSGPVIDDLSNPYQPDPDGSITHNPTSLKGDVALRIRKSSETAFNLGTGISRVTPFTDEGRTDISTPFVAMDHTDRSKAYQFRESIQASMTTTPEMKNVGQFGSIGAGFSVLRNIHYSRWEVGVDTNFQLPLYSRAYDPGPAAPSPAPGGSGGHTASAATSAAGGRAHTRSGITAQDSTGDRNASMFSAGFGPSVRYRFSDSVGSFTSVHFNYYDPRSAGGALAIQHRTMSGRTGIDYAITHAIFFSPFITYYPDAISISTTTLNFSTIFSVF